MAELYVEQGLTESIEKIEKVVEVMAANHEKFVASGLGKDTEKGQDYQVEQLKLKEKVYNLVVQVKLFLSELDIEPLVDKSARIIEALKRFDILSSDYSKFKTAMVSYADSVKNRHLIDSAALGRMWNTVKMGYFPTDLENMKHIKRGIAYPKASVNILDPCVGCGLALEFLSKGENAYTYGAEIDEARAEEARQRIHKLAKGSFFGSRISHEAFHFLFMNPPYLTIKNETGSNVRAEKKFLVETLYHLMIGGLMVYVIPWYRLTPDIARILADNFTDVEIYKFTESEFKKFKQVAIFGTRITKRNGMEYVKSILEAADDIKSMPEVTAIEEGKYRLPAVEREVKVFKGSVFDKKELEEQLSSSRLIDKLFQENELDHKERRPLLPFTIGQIGLIGGSGLINGYIDCDVPHVLKGQITKERKVTDSKENAKGVETSVTEAIINKMSFNVLTIDGIKKLA